MAEVTAFSKDSSRKNKSKNTSRAGIYNQPRNLHPNEEKQRNLKSKKRKDA